MNNTSATRLDHHIAAKGQLLLDGAMGTRLFAKGLTSGDNPELWNVEHPDRVIEIHREYLDAGSDVILSNTFGGTRFRLGLHGLAERAYELNKAGAEVARAAVDGHERDSLVAGSIGPSGELIEPLGETTIAEMVEAFTEQARGLADGGADIIWIETMSAVDEVTAAVDGAKQGAPNLPIVTTMSFDTVGRSMMGVTGAQLAGLAVANGVNGFGANCGATLSETEAAVQAMIEGAEGLYVVSKANSGIPEWSDGGLVYRGEPDVMAAHAIRMKEAGVVLIGACCGSSPDHIAMMRQALDGEIEVADIPAPGPVIDLESPQPAHDRKRRRRRRG